MIIIYNIYYIHIVHVPSIPILSGVFLPGGGGDSRDTGLPPLESKYIGYKDLYTDSKFSEMEFRNSNN